MLECRQLLFFEKTELHPNKIILKFAEKSIMMEKLQKSLLYGEQTEDAFKPRYIAEYK
jgi:hypothetical protein